MNEIYASLNETFKYRQFTNSFFVPFLFIIILFAAADDIPSRWFWIEKTKSSLNFRFFFSSYKFKIKNLYSNSPDFKGKFWKNESNSNELNLTESNLTELRISTELLLVHFEFILRKNIKFKPLTSFVFFECHLVFDILKLQSFAFFSESIESFKLLQMFVFKLVDLFVHKL